MPPPLEPLPLPSLRLAVDLLGRPHARLPPSPTLSRPPQLRLRLHPSAGVVSRSPSLTCASFSVPSPATFNFHRIGSHGRGQLMGSTETRLDWMGRQGGGGRAVAGLCCKRMTRKIVETHAGTCPCSGPWLGTHQVEDPLGSEVRWQGRHVIFICWLCLGVGDEAFPTPRFAPRYNLTRRKAMTAIEWCSACFRITPALRTPFSRPRGWIQRTPASTMLSGLNTHIPWMIVLRILLTLLNLFLRFSIRKATW